jgi:hypothetical protein
VDDAGMQDDGVVDDDQGGQHQPQHIETVPAHIERVAQRSDGSPKKSVVRH